MCDYLLSIGIVKDMIVYYVVHNCQCADEMMHAEVMLNFYIKNLAVHKITDCFYMRTAYASWAQGAGLAVFLVAIVVT